MPGKRDVFQPRYIGKDIVVKGSALILDSGLAWKNISRRARRSIKKAQKVDGFEIKKINGSKDDIDQFRKIWYYHDDPDLGDDGLSNTQSGWFGYLNGELVAGTIVTEVGSNLFLHFNGATSEAKSLQLPSLMIWNVVLNFDKKKFKYLDIGCSFRPNLQTFFKNWATYEYPIIFHSPDLTPQIDISPFDNKSMGLSINENVNVDKIINEKFQNNPTTFFPRGKYALFSVLKYLSLNSDDEVFITTTTGSPYLSVGVSTTIEEICSWSRKISKKTKVVLLIHEFGFIHKKSESIKKMCEDKGYVFIEDCAWAWNANVFGHSSKHYRIYSFPKYFPVQYGGLLVGHHFSDDFIWNNFHCLDFQKIKIIKQQLSNFINKTDEINNARIKNYHYLLHLFEEEGFEPFFKIEKNEIPSALFIKVANAEKMLEIKKSLSYFGIEVGAFHHNNSIFLPIHQNLNTQHLDYIFGSMRSMFRENCGVYPPEYFINITNTKLDRNDHSEIDWSPPIDKEK